MFVAQTFKENCLSKGLHLSETKLGNNAAADTSTEKRPAMLACFNQNISDRWLSSPAPRTAATFRFNKR